MQEPKDRGKNSKVKYLKKGLTCDARRWLLTYKEIKETTRTREFDQLALYQTAVVAGLDFDGENKKEYNLAAVVDLDGPSFKALQIVNADGAADDCAMTPKQAEANTPA